VCTNSWLTGFFKNEAFPRKAAASVHLPAAVSLCLHYSWRHMASDASASAAVARRILYCTPCVTGTDRQVQRYTAKGSNYFPVKRRPLQQTSSIKATWARPTATQPCMRLTDEHSHVLCTQPPECLRAQCQSQITQMCSKTRHIYCTPGSVHGSVQHGRGSCMRFFIAWFTWWWGQRGRATMDCVTATFAVCLLQAQNSRDS